MVLARRDTHQVLKLVDWHLLVFFAALFVVVEGLNGTGLPDQIYLRVRGVFGHTPAIQGTWPGFRCWVRTFSPMSLLCWWQGNGSPISRTLS